MKKCVRLRARYLQLSVQGLFDNPKDRDDYQLYPVPHSVLKPMHAETAAAAMHTHRANRMNESSNDLSLINYALSIDLNLIPSADECCVFRMSEDGVFEVFEESADENSTVQAAVSGEDGGVDSAEAVAAAKPLFEVPSLKEYFRDLDFVLNVVSDGPVKSFAYRRLRYLESKFQLYSLLNEHQELADSKARFIANILLLSIILCRKYRIEIFIMLEKLIRTSTTLLV